MLHREPRPRRRAWRAASVSSRGARLTGVLVLQLLTAACSHSAESSTNGAAGGATSPQEKGGAPAAGGSAQGGSGLGGAANAGGSGGAALATGGSAQGGSGVGGSAVMSGGASGAPVGGTSNTNGGASAGAASGGKSQASGGASAGGAGAPAGGSAATDRFPFPQNKHLAACSYPTNASAADAERAYSAWKTELLTSSGAGGHLRVQRPNSPGAETNSTVSEGIAYGMLIAVAMSDQHTFDELWKYSQTWLDANGLMNWYINAAGTQVLGSGAATDADEDMAWALVMADRKWGGAGTLGTSYLELAKAQIGRIWNSEVDHGASDMLLPGDNWGANPLFNPSYFAPNQYRIFGAVTASPDTWKRVIDTGYSILDKSLNATSKNATNGLVPAWCGSDGMPKSPPSGAATNYQYDSARTPFRIGLDYCFNSEARAKTYLGKVSSFFSGLGAGAIVDGYNLDGTPHPDPDTPTGSPQSAVFVGCAAVGAMHDAKYQSFIDDAYTRVASGQLLARSRYYNLSWTALNLLMLSGNFLEYGN